MLYTTLLVATAAFSGFAAAQNQSFDADLPPTISPCCNVDASKVSDSLRSSWCTASENTCPEICGGQGQIASGGNVCDDKTLKYTCKCRNGTEPDMTKYQQSVPGQMCRFWASGCTNATIGANGEGNSTQQFACDSIRDSQCGNVTINEDSSSTTSASSGSSRPTSTGSGSGSQESGSATSSAANAASSSPGAAIRLAQDFGAPVLAGGMIAIFGIAL